MNQVNEIMNKDVLFIVPPFSTVRLPSLGVHILHANLIRIGINAKILYLNILFSSLIGVDNYEKICNDSIYSLTGERIFKIFKDYLTGNISKTEVEKANNDIKKLGSIISVMDTAHAIENMLQHVVTEIDNLRPSIVGISSSFQQISSSEIIAEAIKKKYPQIILCCGGANCDSSVVDGFAQYSNNIDYFFSGECDEVFNEFVLNPTSFLRINYTKPLREFRPIKTDFSAYFSQLELYKINLTDSWIPFETSRGCWWAMKNRCKFCGLNGSIVDYRQKKTAIVQEEIFNLLKTSPIKKMHFADNLFNYSRYQKMLKNVKDEFPDFEFFAEIRTDINLEVLRSMKKNGLTYFQPGIENLSSKILSKMNKGTTGYNNIIFLLECKRLNLHPFWNFLFGFDNENPDDYREITKNINFLFHLPPPQSLSEIIITKNSTYYNEVIQKKPLQPYYDIFGSSIADKIAYYYTGDLRSTFVNSTMRKKLAKLVEEWKAAWSKRCPQLFFTQLNKNQVLVIDTRINEDIYLIDKDIADYCFSTTKPDSHLNNILLRHNLCIFYEKELINLVEKYIRLD